MIFRDMLWLKTCGFSLKIRVYVHFIQFGRKENGWGQGCHESLCEQSHHVSPTSSIYFKSEGSDFFSICILNPFSAMQKKTKTAHTKQRPSRAKVHAVHCDCLAEEPPQHWQRLHVSLQVIPCLMIRGIGVSQVSISLPTHAQNDLRMVEDSANTSSHR